MDWPGRNEHDFSSIGDKGDTVQSERRWIGDADCGDVRDEIQQTFTDKNHTFCVVRLSTKNLELYAISGLGLSTWRRFSFQLLELLQRALRVVLTAELLIYPDQFVVIAL
jgi:hypothetical protein